MDIKKDVVAPFLAILLLTLLAYLNSFSVPFHFDDRLTIVENVAIRNLLDIKGIFLYNATRFLLTFSDAINFRINAFNPLGYHVVNFSLHAINVALLYIVFSLIIGEKFILFFTALLFAIHPVNVESVTYISGRSSLLCGTFFLLTFFFYITYRQKKKPFPLFLSYIFFVFSMFTKEAAAVALIIFLGYDNILEPEIDRTNKSTVGNRSYLITYIPYTVIIIAILFIRKMLGGNFGDNILVRGYFENLLTQCKSTILSIKLLFLPMNLTIDHNIRTLKSLFALKSLCFISAFLGLLFLIFLLKKRDAIIAFSILFSLSFLIPFFVFPLNDILTERWLYFSSIGFCFVLSKILYNLILNKRVSRLSAITFASIISLSFFLLTLNRNSVWRNEYTLWQDATKKAPAKARPHNNLGVALVRLGIENKAIEEFKKALSIDKNYIDAHNNLGLAYGKMGRNFEAEAEFLKALKLSPSHGGANTNLANLYHNAGRFHEALPYYLRALKVEPKNPLILTNLGILYKRVGRDSDALKILKQSVELGTNLPEAHYNLGILLKNLGRKEEARNELYKALTLKPDDKKIKKALSSIEK